MGFVCTPSCKANNDATSEDSGVARTSAPARQSMFRRLEIATNVAIIVVSILFASVLVKNNLLRQRSNAGASPPSGGTKIQLPDLDWKGNRQTVLLALKEGCRFCDESAPFYRRLASKADDKKIPLIAVLSNPVEEGRAYVARLAFPVKEVRQVSLDVLNVRGTPTVIVVDNQGRVSKAWTGKLSPDHERDVLSYLR